MGWERERRLAAEKDAVFASGPSEFEVRNNSATEAVLFQAQARPHSGWEK